ncbi:MAG: hypothetical protein AAGK04_10160, partial [Planctomycetota bacterium]
RVATWPTTSTTPTSPAPPTALRPAVVPPGLPAYDHATPCAEHGLARVHAALEPHAGAPSLAAQITRALDTLLSPVDVRAPWLFATTIARTDLFGAFVRAMRDDAARCVGAYNEAVAQHPRARMRPLESAGRIELPLWRLTPDARHPVFAGDDAIDTEHLAPRALTMTALLRWAGCDLWVQGLGGAAYDPIMRQWLDDWRPDLGAPIELARAATASATRRLPIETDAPSPEAIRAARMLAHRARHDPALLGDHEAAESKRALVDRIAALPRATNERLSLYRELHTLLEHVRAQHAGRLAEIEREAAALRARADEADIAHDRTYPFPLLPEAAQRALVDDVRARFEA